MEGRPGIRKDKNSNVGHVDNKQERTTMQGKTVEGLPGSEPREPLAANDDFAGAGEIIEPPSDARLGWDPYDVWRTRVKNSTARNEHEADPRR